MASLLRLENTKGGNTEILLLLRSLELNHLKSNLRTSGQCCSLAQTFTINPTLDFATGAETLNKTSLKLYKYCFN